VRSAVVRRLKTKAWSFFGVFLAIITAADVSIGGRLITRKKVPEIIAGTSHFAPNSKTLTKIK
jgi:hypothetical protein